MNARAERTLVADLALAPVVVFTPEAEIGAPRHSPPEFVSPMLGALGAVLHVREDL